MGLFRSAKNCNLGSATMASANLVQQGEKNSFIELTSGNKGTKALINNTSVPDEILCNFLRIDESSAGEFESPSYSTDWLGGKSYISEGDISTISKDICKCI